MDVSITHPACMYAVVCSERTSLVWPHARERLRLKYESKWPGMVHVITYPEDASVTVVLGELSDRKPSFTCFLTHHFECSRNYIQAVSKLTRNLDPSHPYTDTVWGVLTGLNEEDVLYALDQEPLEVGRVVGNCPVDLEKFQSGVWFSELDQGVSYRKLSCEGVVRKETCGPDATELFANELGKRRDIGRKKGVDMVITSGHATEKNLMLGYTFHGGEICCRGGQLYGCPVDGGRVDIELSGTPKILSAAGNCLMGHISDPHCMALGWLHSGCVVQMTGYLVETWFGYGGWGVHKYFVNNPGSMTFAEAFFANQQSLLHQIVVNSAPVADDLMRDHTAIYQQCFNSTESPSPGYSRDVSGLLYDRDNVAFYGDPAWEARLTPNVDLYSYRSKITKLPMVEDDWTHWEYEIVTTTSGQWDCPVPDDKSTYPGRPPVYIFPYAARAAKVVRGRGVVTCRFVLLTLSGAFEVGEEYKVEFATK